MTQYWKEGAELAAAAGPYLYAPSLAAVFMLSLFLGKRILLRRLARLAARTAVEWDDLLLRALSFPLNLLILAVGLAVLTHTLPLPETAGRIATKALQGVLILSMVLFLDRLIVGVLAQKVARSAFGDVSQGVTKGLVRGFIIGLGMLIFLDLIGISITPILASLGIGSLAVALALQDTLSNFFAGIYVTIDKPVRVGDYVRIEGGVEGYVTEIGWRSTRVRHPANNTVVLPNAKLMGSVITNYYLPDREVGFAVECSVAYGSDLEKVERVTIEVAREVLKRTTGAVPEAEPAVRFHTFADSGISFMVALRAREFTDHVQLKHEFIKALHARYARENISIPFPTREVRIVGKVS